MHQILRAAWKSPEGINIPSKSPSALRLSFYGLFGAYRANGQPEIVDGLSIYLTDEGIRIGKSAEDQFAEELAAALKAHKSPTTDLPNEWDEPAPESPTEAARAMLERLSRS